MSFCAADFATNYVPFVDVTDARNAASSDGDSVQQVARRYDKKYPVVATWE
jgi:hypothetical protein